MRVLHVIGPLRTGGAQTQLLGLVRAAHGELWDATVVATSGGALASEFRTLGCPYHELRRRGSPGLLRMRALRRIAASGEFDVIHGNLWQSNAYARLAVVGRKDRPAVVISERNVEAARSAAKRLVDMALAVVTDAYVGNTDAVTEFIRAVHPVGQGQIITTIPNAVDTGIFRPATHSEARETIRIGSVGRLDPEKGFDVLIAAAERLSADRAIEVRIVGEGPELDRLRAAAAGLPVEFVGPRRPGADIADFLRSLDVFVLPSTWREGRPNVLLEAIAVGLPVVATALPGMEEILSSGALIPPNDAVALADALETAAADPDGWRARSSATPVMDFAELGRRYRAVFDAAVARTVDLRS